LKGIPPKKSILTGSSKTQNSTNVNTPIGNNSYFNTNTPNVGNVQSSLNTPTPLPSNSNLNKLIQQNNKTEVSETKGRRSTSTSFKINHSVNVLVIQAVEKDTSNLRKEKEEEIEKKEVNIRRNSKYSAALNGDIKGEVSPI
jgi:hypothetical protein